MGFDRGLDLRQTGPWSTLAYHDRSDPNDRTRRRPCAWSEGPKTDRLQTHETTGGTETDHPEHPAWGTSGMDEEWSHPHLATMRIIGVMDGGTP